MKIFVTGANGFVGSYVTQQLLQCGYEVFASSRSGDLSNFGNSKNFRFVQVDYTDPFSLHDAFEFVQPNVVVHCAAMSKPDDCEKHQAQAFDANVFGTVQLLLAAEKFQSFFIHLSTDFIFDGLSGMYGEEATPNPINYYGKTKLDAEEAVMEYVHEWAIVRTCFVYGAPTYGRDSFITMVAKQLKNNQSLKLVNDQERTPTYVVDLAKGIASIINKRASGVYNLSGMDLLTPYEMGLRIAKYLNLKSDLLTAVFRNDFEELAQRPLKTGLSIDKAIRDLNFSPLSFDEGLNQTLQSISNKPIE